jgi:murein DD-endopeptidase MepM/ murein hydrolase activator NlpD
VAACGATDAGECGPYPSQVASAYLLPYPGGTSYVVGQGNCTDGSHREGSPVQYAYDFLMPIGAEIVASRDGIVVLLEEQYSDDDHSNGHENFVDVRHADGTEAQYVHLTTNGVEVALGDAVHAGQVIGRSGSSGNSSAPHLHFHVLGAQSRTSVPITFRNTRPHPHGLQTGETYAAEP